MSHDHADLVNECMANAIIETGGSLMATTTQCILSSALQSLACARSKMVRNIRKEGSYIGSGLADEAMAQ